MKPYSFKNELWQQFKKNKIALSAFYFLLTVSLIGIYAPFFAASKPLVVVYDHKIYFPLLRYLFFSGYYSKPIDLFFNVLMFTFPTFLFSLYLVKRFFNGRGIKILGVSFLMIQVLLSFAFSQNLIKDPERSVFKIRRDSKALANFDEELNSYSEYRKLNTLIKYHQQKAQKERLLPLIEKGGNLSLLYDIHQKREKEEREKLNQNLIELTPQYNKVNEEYATYLKDYSPFVHELAIQAQALKEGLGEREILEKNYDDAIKKEKEARKIIEQADNIIYNYRLAKSRLLYLDKKNEWLRKERFALVINPLLRTFHWEDDAGGSQLSNQKLPWWERTRLNRKDLAAGLIYGIRVSLIVGFSVVTIALLIGIPLGLFAGYFAGKVDMITLRFIEIWEAMPTFFTLLLISAIFHSKSLFLTILVLGLFSWTSFARYVRAESLRERGLAYIMASKSLGFSNFRIMFSHVLPNAISPLLAILPFAMMAAITSESALSFLGLGEENSTSWGVLMSEARTVFPGESYLLWPPALLLTAFLVAIALVGDGLRDALDPKMKS